MLYSVFRFHTSLIMIGDIEDTLLSLLISARGSKKFSKMDVKRVYFGNWLRDYSQAVDVSFGYIWMTEHPLTLYSGRHSQICQC